MNLWITVFVIAVTVFSYWFSRRLNLRNPTSPLTNVVFLSTTIIIITLVASGLTFEDYTPGKDIMTFLLGPATVALAIPLHKNKKISRTHPIWYFVGGPVYSNICGGSG